MGCRWAGFRPSGHWLRCRFQGRQDDNPALRFLSARRLTTDFTLALSGRALLSVELSNMDSTPVTLLQRVARGNDPQAWQMLVEILLPSLLEWGGRMNLPPEELEDIVQDLFIHLFAVLPSFEYDKTKRFRGWLRTILKRRVIDWHRRRKRKASSLESLDGPCEPYEIDIPELDDQEFQRWLWWAALDLVRNEFSEKTWRSFWEHTVQGRSAADVAAELKIKVDSVYVAKRRVCDLLQKRFGDILD